MTVGGTEETCVGQTEASRTEGDMKRPLTFTTLSSIAVQSGQSQIVVSVLKSGSSVHLQLVHVHPILCEIGSNQEENKTLIKEQQQLLEKLKKHEREVLSSVNKKWIEVQRKMENEWMFEQKRNQEEEEGVYRAMEASLSEGWTLLLRLLNKRLHVLALAADFYCKAHQFAAGIERLKDLEIKPDRLTDVQLTYDCIRRDLLGRSLQLLSSSGDLCKKLRELQKTEAFQRRGGVLQDEVEEGDEETSQCSWGPVLRLEQIVESLQDQRRSVDQEVKLQLQQTQNNTKTCCLGYHESEDWSLSLDKLLEQDPQSGSEAELKLDLKPEETKSFPAKFNWGLKETEEKFTSSSNLISVSSNDTINLQSEAKMVEGEELQVESRTEDQYPTPECAFEETETLHQASDQNIVLDSEDIQQESEVENAANLEPLLEPESGPDLNSEPRLMETQELYIGYSSNIVTHRHLDIECDQKREAISNVQVSNKNLQTRSPSNNNRNQASKIQLGLHSRSLPVFNLSSKKLQPKLQFINFTEDSSPMSELEQKSESKLCKPPNLCSAFNSQSIQHTMLKKLLDSEDLQQESESDNARHFGPEAEPGQDLDRESGFTETRELPCSSSLNNIADLHLEIKSDQQTGVITKANSISNENQKTLPVSRDTKDKALEAPLEQPRSLPVYKSKQLQWKWQENKDLFNNSTTKPSSKSGSEQTLESKSYKTKAEANCESKSEETRQPNCEEIVDSKCGLEDDLQTDLNVKPATTSEPQPLLGTLETVVEKNDDILEMDMVSNAEKIECLIELHPMSTPEMKLGETKDLLPQSTYTSTVHPHREEIQKLHSSCDQLADKVCVWLQQCSSVLSVSFEAGQCLSEAEHSVRTHLQLQSQAQAAGQDAECMQQILDQIQALCPDSPGNTSVSSLKVLTKQLRRSTRTSPAAVLNPELTARIDLILKELKTVNTTVESNLQLLQPYVTFLQTAEEVKVDFGHLSQTYSKRPEEQEDCTEAKMKTEAQWQTALQKFLNAQERGNSYRSDVNKVLKPGINRQSVTSVVTETMKRLSETKDELTELRKHYQTQLHQLQEDNKFCHKYRERLLKTVKDLKYVSDLLDSCTVIDLGLEQHTSKLQEQFTLARPHFTQLDTEANFIMTNFETLGQLLKKQEVKVTQDVTEEDVSELLDLHLRLKQKIKDSESVLELSSSFHLTAKQLEALLQAEPMKGLSGQSGSDEDGLNLFKEEKEQIHNLFNKASLLKMDVCHAIEHGSVSGFRVEQLEARLQCLDSLCVSWLSEAARCEEKLLREKKTRLLLDDINQLRDSFKELKKRFSNLKYNYQKRNDRSRNMKAVRNQLQQVDTYEEKLQVLKSRLHALTTRLGSEVKNKGATREVEDVLNELQRQMGEFERAVKEHQKTLDMTCRLQEAMDEYQFWCKEASGTIARVGKFSTECRSTEAVSVLYRQFEKFVWPTVPQQEERISQITELAIRLHGVEEGRRYIEKTVSKHSKIVEAIRELSNGLLELEAKLKLQSLKQQKKDEELVTKEDEAMERFKNNDTENKVEEMKEKEKWKKKEQTENCTTQEAAEMYELKETGHTPELTNKQDGKEIPVRRHSANKKPPLQKSRCQETDSHRQTASSYCSTHTFSFSCSPLETNRQVHAFISQTQPAMSQATPIQATPSPRELQNGKKEETRELASSASCRFNTTPQDTAAASLLETELHQHEVMSEDSLSNDEYDCPSPDDISLPPMAETPESFMIQSDVEEGLCFSSQHSYRCHIQSEHSETGELQHRESSEIQRGSTPPTIQHSVNRFRSESGTFVQTPVTVPIPTQVTTIILKTEDTTSLTPKPVHNSHMPDQPSIKSKPIPLTHSRDDEDSSQTISFMTPSIETSIYMCPNISLTKSFTVSKSSIQEERSCSKNLSIDTKSSRTDEKSQSDQAVSNEDTLGNLTLSNSDTKDALDLNVLLLPTTTEVPSLCISSNSKHTAVTTQQTFICHSTHSGSHYKINLNKEQNFSKDTGSLESSANCQKTETVKCQVNKSSMNPESGLVPSAPSVQENKETSMQAMYTNSNNLTTVMQGKVYSESSMSSSYTLVHGGSNPALVNDNPSPCTTDSALHKDNHRQVDNTLQHSNTDLNKDLGCEVTSSQNKKIKETPSESLTQSNSLSTIVKQETVPCKSSTSSLDSHCKKSDSPSSFVQNTEDPTQEVNAPISQDPDSISRFSPSSNATSSSETINTKQNHQTVLSHLGSSQQYVHGLGLRAQPGAPLPPTAQTQALAQQANPHVTPSLLPPHLLTPEQDPDICQPMTIREEIRLTPQIKGPPIPAPPPSPPLGESLPLCSTRPVSRASLSEGSPVALEVEVTGQPEPTLTWWVAYNQLHKST